MSPSVLRPYVLDWARRPLAWRPVNSEHNAHKQIHSLSVQAASFTSGLEGGILLKLGVCVSSPPMRHSSSACRSQSGSQLTGRTPAQAHPAPLSQQRTFVASVDDLLGSSHCPSSSSWGQAFCEDPFFQASATSATADECKGQQQSPCVTSPALARACVWHAIAASISWHLGCERAL